MFSPRKVEFESTAVKKCTKNVNMAVGSGRSRGEEEKDFFFLNLADIICSLKDATNIYFVERVFLFYDFRNTVTFDLFLSRNILSYIGRTNSSVYTLTLSLILAGR